MCRASFRFEEGFDSSLEIFTFRHVNHRAPLRSLYVVQCVVINTQISTLWKCADSVLILHTIKYMLGMWVPMCVCANACLVLRIRQDHLICRTRLTGKTWAGALGTFDRIGPLPILNLGLCAK